MYLRVLTFKYDLFISVVTNTEELNNTPLIIVTFESINKYILYALVLSVDNEDVRRTDGHVISFFFYAICYSFLLSEVGALENV